jgi:putative spermidine/putrescine transport system permease protein
VDEVKNRMPISGIVVLVIGALYFVVPILATIQFSLEQGHQGYGFGAYRQILDDPAFRHTLWFSVQLALETTVVTMLLMVPTVYWVHLRLPKIRPVVESVTILPFVIPPIVLVVGLFDFFKFFSPDWLLEQFVFSPKFLVAAYVVISLPFVYRALDAGVRAVDVQTLTEAAQSLGASRTRTLFRVILPNLREAVLAASLLTFVIVLGEFTIASIALYQTFPVYITTIGSSQAFPAGALTVISVGLTFAAAALFLWLGRVGSRRASDSVLAAGLSRTTGSPTPTTAGGA